LFFICKTDKSKPVKQVNGTVILPPLVFPAYSYSVETKPPSKKGIEQQTQKTKTSLSLTISSSLLSSLALKVRATHFRSVIISFVLSVCSTDERDENQLIGESAAERPPQERPRSPSSSRPPDPLAASTERKN
jgi:hypothetical protein